MALEINEEPKLYTSVDDDEEDALLNEAISCSKNLEIKTDDDEDDDDDQQRKENGSCKQNNEESQKQKSTDTELCDKNSDSNQTNGKIEEHTNSVKVNVETKEEPNDMDTREAEVMDTNSTGSIASPDRKRLREEELEEGEVRNSRNRTNSNSSCGTMSNNSKKIIEYETDPAVLARRQKDIDYGKNTIGYDRYIQEIPRDQRLKDHPRTPPMYLKHSRRGWDGMVKLWRKQLHFWDPQDENEKEEKSEKEKENEDVQSLQC